MKNYVSYLILCFIAFFAVPSFAAGPDYTSLMAGVDFGTTTTAILAAAALLAVVMVARKGAKLILGFIK